MTETIFVQTPLTVTFVIRRDDAAGPYVGHLRQFPGIISQGRTREAVRRKLIGLLREISRENPEELHLFR